MSAEDDNQTKEDKDTAKSPVPTLAGDNTIISPKPPPQAPLWDTLKTANLDSPKPRPQTDVFEVLKQLKREELANNQSTPQTEAKSPSVLLAPTAPALRSPNETKPQHRRDVSWDTSSVLYQAANKHPSNSKLPNASTASPQPILKVKLQDVTQQHPLESEAETYILRALETRDPTGMGTIRLTTVGSSNVVTNLPDEALDAMLENSHRDTAPKPSVRALDTSTRATAASVRIQQQLATTKKTTGHKRTTTMEMQLDGLATAIDTAQANNWSHIFPDHNNDAAQLPSSHSDHQHDRLNTTDPVLTGDRPQIPNSAAEVGQNTSILYKAGTWGGTITDLAEESSDDSDESSVSELTAAARWGALRNALKVASPHAGDSDDDASLKNTAQQQTQQEEVDEEQGNSKRNKQKQRKRHKLRKEKGTPVKLFREIDDFFSPRRNSIFLWLRVLLLYIMVPLIGVAAILFYLADNPPTGVLQNNGKPVNDTLLNQDGNIVDPEDTSVSWWLLFVLRQVLMASAAKFTELFVVEYLTIQSGRITRVFGPWCTLFLLQSRGRPFLVFMWGVYDFLLLSGDHPFTSHWIYWQDAVDLFNRSNPSGNVITSDWYRKILSIAVSVGATVAVKRFWLGLYLGRQTFTHYSEKLASVMQKILLVSELGSLGRDFERYITLHADGTLRDLPLAAEFGLNADRLGTLLEHIDDVPSTKTFDKKPGTTTDNDVKIDRIVDPHDRSPLTGALSRAQKTRISQLLGVWEEPKVAESYVVEIVSVKALLQFRRALVCLHTPFPFSGSFGLADTRENTIESAQEVYYRLMLRTPTADCLNFEIIALLGVTRNGTLDQEKLKEIIRLFRPNRDGTISILDFVKSIDAIYKELRMLRASVANSSKIDHAFENIFNVFFYVIVITIILSQLGFDPLALFLSISGVVLAFAFMIGSASSKYFEGLLFILVRRPFNVGDGIHASNPESETSYSGSAWWTVEDVSLFTTSVVFMFTNEKATLSNGSLAGSRIINSSCSPQAVLSIKVKFPVHVKYEELQIFHEAAEEFMKNRPREWLQFIGFRATSIEVDQGFIQYSIIGRHRSGWADWGALMMSKADLMKFSFELQRKLKIKYKSPPLPIDFRMLGQQQTDDEEELSPGTLMNELPLLSDLGSLQAQFAPDKKNV